MLRNFSADSWWSISASLSTCIDDWNKQYYNHSYLHILSVAFDFWNSIIHRVSSVKFSVTEEWQRSKRGFFVGYWGTQFVWFDCLRLDRSMYASCHDISCVTGVIQSSQFWRIAVSGPNLTVNIEFIPFKVWLRFIIIANGVEWTEIKRIGTF